jgi:hypothetical protein
MAIAQAQYVDLLVKQLYGVAKTDTSTIKSPSNESIASPALIRGDTQWTQSDQIPGTAAAVANVVQAYTGVNAVQCSPDTTTVPVGGVYPTWLTNLTNWIPQEFGSTYVVQAWVDSPGVANPTLTGTQIFASGSGGTGEYYYDNIAGLLNFIGGTIPAVLTSSKVIYIVGYRYIGLVGVTHLPGNLAIGNLNFTGTTISSTNLNGNIIITPNGSGIVQVSSALTSNANITASFFIGNGSQLTGVAASNAVSSGTVTDNAQPNITSVGTLTSLTVSGNIVAGNLMGIFANGNSNISIPSINGNINLSSAGNANILVITGTGANVTGNLGLSGNLTGANVISANTITGTLTTASQPNITSTGTLTSLTVSGTTNLGAVGNIIITGGSTGYYLQTNGSGNLSWSAVPVGSGISNGNSNINIPVASGNVNISAVGNANVLVVTGTGTNITGTLDVSGNATASNLIAGTGSGGSIIGANLVSANYFTGTLTTSAQPNITSIGTLTSLSVTGNISGANANLGNSVTANYFTGNLYGTANLATYATTANSVAGANVTGQVGNALVASTVYTNAQPNITSTGTLTSLNVSGPLIANTFQMGYGVYAFYSTSVYFATTASTSPNQILWNYPAADLTAIDFTIIATNSSGLTRQSCKISAAILGTSVSFNEYGGLYINGGVGSFSVVYNGSGPTPTLDLVVTPDSTDVTEYNMLISKYLV